MSRRFSDDPINLIDRIPSRAQISAARPSSRSWGRAVLESGAACIRGAAEVIAQVRRFWRMVRGAVAEGAVFGKASLSRFKQGLIRALEAMARAKTRAREESRLMTVRLSHTYERLAEWIANLDVAVPPVPPSKTQQVAIPLESTRPVPAEQLSGGRTQELAELKASILSQQQELAHVSAQLLELKALVVSQQQVLMFLGKELDAPPTVSVATASSAPAKRSRVARVRSTGKEKKAPPKGASKPSLNL